MHLILYAGILFYVWYPLRFEFQESFERIDGWKSMWMSFLIAVFFISLRFEIELNFY